MLKVTRISRSMTWIFESLTLLHSGKNSRILLPLSQVVWWFLWWTKPYPIALGGSYSWNHHGWRKKKKKIPRRLDPTVHLQEQHQLLMLSWTQLRSNQDLYGGKKVKKTREQTQGRCTTATTSITHPPSNTALAWINFDLAKNMLMGK